MDLISQKIEFKNMMNQSVTGNFVTVILELTHDFISKLEEQEQQIIQQQVQLATSSTGQTPENMNIKFIKPSPHFYTKMMCLWFKFNHLHNGEDNNIRDMELPQIRVQFLDFSVKQFKQVGSWNPQLLIPMENTIRIISQEYFYLFQQS